MSLANKIIHLMRAGVCEKLAESEYVIEAPNVNNAS